GHADGGKDGQGDAAADEPEPLEAPGLADGGEPEAEPADQQPAASEPEQRLVGGGALDSEVLPPDPRASDAQARFAQVMRGDTPATLFERMNRAEGRPRAPQSGKDW